MSTDLSDRHQKQTGELSESGIQKIQSATAIKCNEFPIWVNLVSNNNWR